jgi:hypothetical protein
MWLSTFALRNGKTFALISYLALQTGINACRLVFIVPVTALMNLFFYIIQHPTLDTVESDLDSMYRVCGHFNYLEYMSPGIKFSFPREVTNLARLVLAKSTTSPLTNKTVEEGMKVPTRSYIPNVSDIATQPLYNVCFLTLIMIALADRVVI